MKKLIFFALLFLPINNSWSWFYINNIEQLREMSLEQRSGWIVGLHDQYLASLILNGGKWIAVGIDACLANFSTDSSKLYIALDESYFSEGVLDEKLRDLNPTIAFESLLNKKCKLFIDKEKENYYCQSEVPSNRLIEDELCKFGEKPKVTESVTQFKRLVCPNGKYLQRLSCDK